MTINSYEINRIGQYQVNEFKKIYKYLGVCNNQKWLFYVQNNLTVA